MNEIVTEKRCSKCKKIKPFSAFAKDARRKYGLRPDCNDCKKESDSYYRRVVLKKPARVYENYKDRFLSKRNTSYKQKYGITLTQYNEILLQQNGRCAICNGDNNGKNLVVDHSHKTGNVRGLLCHSCNIRLGRMRDDENLALNTYTYLVRSKTFSY